MQQLPLTITKVDRVCLIMTFIAGFMALMVPTVNIMVFWFVMPCSSEIA